MNRPIILRSLAIGGAVTHLRGHSLVSRDPRVAAAAVPLPDAPADLGPEYRQRTLDPRRGLPHYIQLLQDLMRAIEAQQPRLTVVRDD